MSPQPEVNMIEWFDTRPDTNVQEAEYKRLLGYPPNHSLGDRARELADWARDWYAKNGRPWIYARQTGLIELRNENLIRIGDAEFTSTKFHDQLQAAEADGAVLVAVSAGRECEEKARELWREGKPDEYFFLEIFGSAVVEHLVARASGRICAWADENGMAALPHYSPGYSQWEISEQIKLWNLIRQNSSGDFSGELRVLDSGMLQPKKSLLAVFGITRRLEKVRAYKNLVPCENCSLPSCQYRRAPYKNFPSQIEDVLRLRANGTAPYFQNGTEIHALTRDARYSVNERALKKWSDERLQLTTLPEGAIEAHFRYEGTTCSNLGHSLEYDYHIKLASHDEDYRILETNCTPAPGDTGHMSQCEYLNNSESLTRSIAEEKPLLGQPLNNVLTWQRQYDPSGCYCDANRRAHKWGLVFEVIHYALVQREKAGTNGHSRSVETISESV
jgi:hypothetical protein